jgi:hypothetical protein
MAAKLTKLTHKIAIQLHLVAETSTICSSCSRRSVRKLLVTPSYNAMIRDSSVGRPGFNSRKGKEFISSPLLPARLWSPHRPLSGGYRGTLLLGVNRLEPEADHLPPSSAKVKNGCIFTSIPPHILMVWCLSTETNFYDSYDVKSFTENLKI